MRPASVRSFSSMESYAGMVNESLEGLGPEERHRVYKLLRLGVRFRPEWPLEITGIFAEVEGEAQRPIVLQTFAT